MKTKTKEEILSKHLMELGAMNVSVNGCKSEILKAMEEYATQFQSDAVEFAEWAAKHYPSFDENKVTWMSERNDEGSITTSDLYSSFLKEKGAQS